MIVPSLASSATLGRVAPGKIEPLLLPALVMRGCRVSLQGRFDYLSSLQRNQLLELMNPDHTHNKQKSRSHLPPTHTAHIIPLAMM